MYKNIITLTKEQWIEVLQDKNLMKEKYEEILLTMYSLGGAATPTLLSTVNELNKLAYNSHVVSFSKRVIKHFNLSESKLTTGEASWWSLPFDGRYLENNTFQWIIKGELMEALKELIDSNKLNFKAVKDKNIKYIKSMLNKSVSNFEEVLSEERKGIESRRSLITEFNSKFPLDNFMSLSLEDYALGKESDNLCWWLEYNTYYLGGVKGGNAKKHKIYFSKKEDKWIYPKNFNNEVEAWEALRESTYKFLLNFKNTNKAIIEDDFILAPMIRAKLLYMYFDDKLLPIFSNDHLISILKLFDIEFNKDKSFDIIYLNKILKEFKDNSMLFNTMDDNQFMNYIYTSIFSINKYYKIAVGEDDNSWETCFENNYIKVGWNETGDLSEFADYNDFKEKFIEAYPEYTKSKATEKANELWAFYNLDIGDIIVANKGTKTILGIGEIADKGYYYDENAEGFKHAVSVKWRNDFKEKEISPQKRWAFETVKAISQKLYEEINSVDEIKGKKNTDEKDSDNGVIKKAEITFTEEEEKFFLKLESNLERKGNIILYGPPGTGKTYTANKYLEWCNVNKDREFKKQLCTFHPSFNYEDFIEGYKPTNINGQTTFALKNGIFKSICEEAVLHEDKDFYFIIDEINRGNVEKIFGEMITLIEKDKRGVSLTLSQSGQAFFVPKNVYIIGTMNTSDKSIRMLDAAIRRRFSFIECMPNYLLLDNEIENLGISPADVLKIINNKLRAIEDRDKQIGHSYFMRDGVQVSTVNSFREAYVYDIIPLISEYCFNDYKVMGEIIGESFIDSENEEIKNDLIDGTEDFFIDVIVKKFGESND